MLVYYIFRTYIFFKFNDHSCLVCLKKSIQTIINLAVRIVSTHNNTNLVDFYFLPSTYLFPCWVEFEEMARLELPNNVDVII